MPVPSHWDGHVADVRKALAERGEFKMNVVIGNAERTWTSSDSATYIMNSLTDEEKAKVSFNYILLEPTR